MPAWVPLAGKALAGAAKLGPLKPVIDAGAKMAGNSAAARRERQTQRDHAARLARQVGGKLSEATLVGSPQVHLIVWKDRRPFAAFPHVEGDLAERPELQDVPEELLFDPPPPRLPRHARKAANKPLS